MPRPIRDSIKSIINSYRTVRVAGTGRASQLDRPYDARKPESKLLVDYDSEVYLFEQTLENVAKVLAAREKLVTAIETLVSLGSEELPADLRRAAEEERRVAALSERGRTPVEVAALYGYARSSSVIRLRERHGLDPANGEPLPKPVTAPAREQLETFEGGAGI